MQPNELLLHIALWLIQSNFHIANQILVFCCTKYCSRYLLLGYGARPFAGSPTDIIARLHIQKFSLTHFLITLVVVQFRHLISELCTASLSEYERNMIQITFFSSMFLPAEIVFTFMDYIHTEALCRYFLKFDSVGRAIPVMCSTWNIIQL